MLQPYIESATALSDIYNTKPLTSKLKGDVGMAKRFSKK